MLTSRGAAPPSAAGAPVHTPSCAVLIAHAFPPLNVIGAQRAARMARVFLDRYDRVYVIGLDPRKLDPQLLDFEFGKEVLEHPRLTFLPCNPILDRFEFSGRPSQVQRIVGAVVGRLLCGHGLDWIPALTRALASIPDTCGIRVVLATGYPFIPFLAAVRWAAQRSAPVILDYRDLWTRNPRAPHPRLARHVVRALIEKRVNRAATALTTVSEGCRHAMTADAAATPIRVVLNSPDAAYLRYYESVVAEWGRTRDIGSDVQRPLRIVFTGQVYPECTFAPLLSVLLQSSAAVSERIEVHYYGGRSARVRAEFERFGLSNRLVDHGLVSKECSIKAILGADLLLSLIHTESVSSDPAVTGLMTTKLYDYLLSGNPILNIAPVDAEVNAFAKRIGYEPFHSFVAADAEGLGRFVARFASGAPLPRLAPLAVPLPSFADQLRAVLDEVERAPA